MALDYFQREPILVVAAHPDDETIGMGGQFDGLRDIYIIHTTNGAPRSILAGDRYAAQRRRELEAAMDLAGIPKERCLELGANDQESSFSLPRLTRRLRDCLMEIRPIVIVTHPYEGGHPDHDSCAFMVQAAVSMMEVPDTQRPMRIEFTSYHNGRPSSGSTQMRFGEFLPGPSASAISTISLQAAARERKRRMFDCFTSQDHVLKEVEIGVERFRPAPDYDFSKPPHSGLLFYEDKDWGISGEQWRALALAATTELHCDRETRRTIIGR